MPRPTEDPEIVKREERIRPGAVRELQQRGQEMSDPTTAETPTMLERLARLHAGRFYDSDPRINNGPEHRQEYVDFRWPVFVKGVEEDLRELGAMGYVVAKLEGRVNEQDRKPPEDAA